MLYPILQYSNYELHNFANCKFKRKKGHFAKGVHAPTTGHLFPSFEQQIRERENHSWAGTRGFFQ